MYTRRDKIIIANNNIQRIFQYFKEDYLKYTDKEKYTHFIIMT